MKPYKGYRSWNAWSVSLWIKSDVFRDGALSCIKDAKNVSMRTTDKIAGFAAHTMRELYITSGEVKDRTSFNQLSVKLCMLELMKE